MKFLKYFLIVLALMTCKYAIGQDLPPDGGTGDELDAPLDGGIISILIATAVGYVFHRRKEKKV